MGMSDQLPPIEEADLIVLNALIQTIEETPDDGVLLPSTVPTFAAKAVVRELRRLREENERLKANRATLAPTWTPRDYGAPCTCLRCLRERDERDPSTGLPVTSTRMFGCPTCGNKRCPHGADHRVECVGNF